jgi:hypothetical protein
MTFKKIASLGMMLLGVGCGVSATDELELTQEESSGTAAQTLTETRTLSWAALSPNKHCQFGNTTVGNQAATNSRASGRKEETITLTGMAGKRITSLRLRTPGGQTASFRYDDVLTVNYSNFLLLSSDRRVAGYSAGAAPDAIGNTIISYEWPNILSQPIDNQSADTPWCTSGASTCSVPPTETAGSVDVNIGSFKALDELAYPSAPDSRTFTLVTIGDNDDGTFNSGYQTSDTDCTHGKLDLELIITSEGVVLPPKTRYYNVPLSQLQALHNGCTAADMSATPGYSRSCIAASHRYCINQGYEGAIITELDSSVPDYNVGVDCFRGKAFSRVNISQLSSWHSGCTIANILTTREYSYACQAAASRLCQNQGYSTGVLQEISSPYLWVSCVDRPAWTDYVSGVPVSTYGAYNSTCLSSFNKGEPDADKYCRSAARRYCRQVHNATSGLATEWGASSGDIVCLRARQ